jgi:hypothetical protein
MTLQSMTHSLPLVPAKAGTQFKDLDSRLRGNERNQHDQAQS